MIFRLFQLKVDIEGVKRPEPISEVCEFPIKLLFHTNSAVLLQFKDAGLHPIMLENIRFCKYDKPTPIQRYCIPSILQGYDLLSCAQTGNKPRHLV